MRTIELTLRHAP